MNDNLHDPADVNALVRRAAAHQAQDDFAKAGWLREVARIEPHYPFILNQLALCMKEQTRFAGAAAVSVCARIAAGCNA